MTQVLDYSVARPAPQDIVSAGYVGVMRYLAPEIDAPKVIYAPEYNALHAAGLQVGLNWEWYKTRPREGAASGTADAQEALQQANALGYMGAIYFSVDYDAPESDQPAINAYFQAAAQVLGLARLGAYAGYWPLKRLFDAGLISYGWQTLAWSGGNREARASIYQNGAQAFDGGADVNDVLKANWAGGNMSLQLSQVSDYFEPSGDGWQCKQTGALLHGGILAAYQSWPAQGSLSGFTAFGLPLKGEETDAHGNPQQDFERGRLRYDPNRTSDNPPGASGPVYAAHDEPASAPTPGPDPTLAALQAKVTAVQGLIGTIDTGLQPFLQLKNAIDQLKSGVS